MASQIERVAWGSVYHESELYKAAVRLYTKPLFDWHKALSTSTDERTLYDFARKGLKNLHAVHASLAARRFHFRPGLALHHNFNGKHRTLYVYPWEERLADLLLYRLLNRRLNNWFSTDSYAYRIGGWGVDKCQRNAARVIAAARGTPLYVIKRDISDYFGSIDHAILFAMLAALVQPDDYLSDLLRERVRFRYVDDGVEHTARVGVPFGTAIACFFANVYLTEMDRALSAIPGVRYFRYADDLLVLSGDRAAAVAASETIEGHLAALRLRSNARREAELVLAPPPHAADARFSQVSHFRHLGLDFRSGGGIGLSRDKGRKIRNLFRYAFRRRAGGFRRLKDPVKKAQLAVELSRKVLDQGVRNVAIVDYYLRHVDDERQLRELDRWLAEEVLSLAFGGHSRRHFRQLSFARLRAMGLPSLVHRRRLIAHGRVDSTFFVWKSRIGVKRSGARVARARERSSDRKTAPFSPCPEAAALNTL